MRSDIPIHSSVNEQANLLLRNDPGWYDRFEAVKRFSRTVRASEYHLTNPAISGVKVVGSLSLGMTKQQKKRSPSVNGRRLSCASALAA